MGLFKKLAGTMLSAFKIGGPSKLTIDCSAVSGKTLTVQDVNGYAVASKNASASLSGNKVLASPDDGSTDQPDFRSLVARDIPQLLRDSHIVRSLNDGDFAFLTFDSRHSWPTSTSTICKFFFTASTNSTDGGRTDCDEGYVFGTFQVDSTDVTTDAQAATLTITFNEIILATSSAKVGSNTILTDADVGTMAYEDASSYTPTSSLGSMAFASTSSYVAYASLSSTITDLLAATTQAGARTAIGAGTGNGTVTSVGLSLPAIFSVSGSPVTSSGSLTGSLATQSANTIFAGPTTGSAAAPTFRTMVAADVPDGLISTAKLADAAVTPAKQQITPYIGWYLN